MGMVRRGRRWRWWREHWGGLDDVGLLVVWREVEVVLIRIGHMAVVGQREHSVTVSLPLPVAVRWTGVESVVVNYDGCWGGEGRIVGRWEVVIMLLGMLPLLLLVVCNVVPGTVVVGRCVVQERSHVHGEQVQTVEIGGCQPNSSLTSSFAYPINLRSDPVSLHKLRLQNATS